MQTDFAFDKRPAVAMSIILVGSSPCEGHSFPPPHPMIEIGSIYLIKIGGGPVPTSLKVLTARRGRHASFTKRNVRREKLLTAYPPSRNWCIVQCIMFQSKNYVNGKIMKILLILLEVRNFPVQNNFSTYLILIYIYGNVYMFLWNTQNILLLYR